MRNITYLNIFSLFLMFTLPMKAQNTLQNPSFETSDGQGGVANWQKRPATWQDNQVFHSGSHAYRIDPGTNQYTFYHIEPDSILVGREYTLSAWTKTKNQNTNAAVYWRYINFTEGGNQFAPFDMNNLTDTTWTYVEWDFYPDNNDARLDIFWNFSEGNFWIDDISMRLKERSLSQIHALPEPWRLNIGDQDTCTIFVELQDAAGFQVSNASNEVVFNNLNPEILTLISPDTVQAVFGKTSTKLIGTNTAGMGRIEIQSGDLRDTLWISNREKYVHDEFFHIGTMLFGSVLTNENRQLIDDLDSIGINIVFPINGGTTANLNLLETIQAEEKNIKVIAQTHFINAAAETFYPQKDWAGAVAKAQEYADLFSPFDTLLYGYRLSDEPDNEFHHHRVAFHSNALYAADPDRQAVTIDAWAFHLTERNMRIRNNDFKMTYLYPFNANTPLGIYPFDYGGLDSETAFDSLNHYDNKPWFHMVQSFTMDLNPPIKRWPEAAEMKLQAYSAVSFGAKGIYYFFYHDIPGHPQEIRGLTESGFPIVHRQLWQPARDINWNLRHNERVFLKGIHSAESNFATSDNALIRIADFELDETNGKYIMLVNRNALDTIEAELEILATGIDMVENKFSTGGEILDFENGMLQVKIHPGDAMLINLQAEILGLNHMQTIDNQMSVFPNPSTDRVHIQLEKPIQNGHLWLSDASGKIVFSRKITGQGYSFSVKDFPKGTYFLSLELEVGFLVEQVLIKK